MAKIHFIIDPISSSIGPQWPYEQQSIEGLTKDFEIHIVRSRSHAEHLARKARNEGAELVVSVGGDETLNEIANALHPQTEDSPAIAIYPGLQRGDLVRWLPQRENFLSFLKAFLSNEVEERRLDIGEISYTGEYGQPLNRVFINYAAFGFAAVIMQKLRKARGQSISRYRFLRTLMNNIPFYKIPVLKLSIDDHGPVSGPLLTGIVHNINHVGGGLRITRDSNPTDGQFELTRLHKASRFKYLLAAVPLYSGQTKGISFLEKLPLKSIKMESSGGSRSVRLDFDGEVRGFLPARIEVQRQALRFLC